MVKLNKKTLVKLFVFKSLYFWFGVLLFGSVILLNYLPKYSLSLSLIISFIICSIFTIFCYLLIKKKTISSDSPDQQKIEVPKQIVNVINESPLSWNQINFREISGTMSANFNSNEIYISPKFVDLFNSGHYNKKHFKFLLYHEIRHLTQDSAKLLTYYLPITYLLILFSLYFVLGISNQLAGSYLLLSLTTQLFKNFIYNYLEMDADIYSCKKNSNEGKDVYNCSSEPSSLILVGGYSSSLSCFVSKKSMDE